MPLRCPSTQLVSRDIFSLGDNYLNTNERIHSRTGPLQPHRVFASSNKGGSFRAQCPNTVEDTTHGSRQQANGTRQSTSHSCSVRMGWTDSWIGCLCVPPSTRLAGRYSP
eukprot:scaffold80765_cov33-Tisochrysis_lutea.AAC.3